MPLPVVSVAQMRVWEQATWAGGQTEAEVIRRVGRVLAQRARELTRDGDLLLLLAGPGHNGDDARAAVEHLAGRQVELLNVTDPAAALPALEAVLARRPALVVDALFGVGLNRPLDVAWGQFIERFNAARRCVLAVDVPSGLNADTGVPAGAVVEATITLTVGAPKLGLLAAAAVPCVGRLEVADDIGLAPCAAKSELAWTLPGDLAEFPPRRPDHGHKGNFGHLGIVAGSLGYHGAGVLAARGAQRARPGLITLHPMEAIYHVVAAQLQAVMVLPLAPETKLPGDFTALLIGPGLAAPDIPAQLQTQIRHIWRDAKAPVIADASALDWLAMEPVARDAVRVMTPHPGEAARLLRSTVERVQADRPAALREISRRFGHCWVVLKGRQTLVGRSTGEIFVNPSGNPHLAQGGSGDLLAGFIAGLLAQPPLATEALTAVRYAVWQHGAAADRLEVERPNWVVEDLAARLGAA